MSQKNMPYVDKLTIPTTIWNFHQSVNSKKNSYNYSRKWEGAESIFFSYLKQCLESHSLTVYILVDCAKKPHCSVADIANIAATVNRSIYLFWSDLTLLGQAIHYIY